METDEQKNQKSSESPSEETLRHYKKATHLGT